jgi:hypothetical protein
MTGTVITMWIAPNDGKTRSVPDEYAHMLANKAIIQGRITTCSVLEAGTTNKRTSVGLVIETEDGKVIFAETTARCFITAAAGVKGAMERFNDDWTTA